MPRTGMSLIQTADGALAVIDEKLIRMKELAEQAATGSYTTAHRAQINSRIPGHGRGNRPYCQCDQFQWRPIAQRGLCRV